MDAWTLRGDTPAYQQIIEQVQRRVAEGHLRPGEPLPTVRDLARQLRLNPGTVARAYAELEREGCIVTRRGGGSFVADRPDVGPWLVERQSRLSRLAERTVVEALSLGYRAEEIVAAVATHLSRWQRQREGAAPTEGTDTLRFAGSHDLAVEVLLNQFRHAHPSFFLSARYTGSVGGLMALLNGEANIAGSHLLDEESGEYNLPLVRRLLPGKPVILITLVERWQGLIVPRGNPKGIARLVDLTRPDVTFVNRQPGSGTRLLLDQQLRTLGLAPEQVRGYKRQEETHLAVATAVARGEADVGLGIHAAAYALGLDFVPLARERYDLIVLRDEAGSSAVRTLLDILQQETFRHVVAGLGGYDTTKTGQVIAI
jgi:molybdate-binding protein/DNA-binding transcriptional regulator YhcF (GntR family)